MRLLREFPMELQPDFPDEQVDAEHFPEGFFDQPAPTPQDFKDGVQLVYGALAVGTALLSKNAAELAAFLHDNGPEVVMAIGEEISAAREWCEGVVAALTMIEGRTLATAMTLAARA